MYSRAEGSSKIHSRLEQQTSRLSQQMRSNNSSSSNKSSASSKSSPPKEKTSPASPMDDIERGDVLSDFFQMYLKEREMEERFCCMGQLLSIIPDHISSSLFVLVVHRADGRGEGHGPAEQRRQLVGLKQLLVVQQ